MSGDFDSRSSRFIVLYSQVYGSKKQRVWREGTLSVNFHTASLFDTESQNRVTQFRGSGITPNCAYKKMVEANNGLSWHCGTEVRIGAYNIQIENVLELHLIPITERAPNSLETNMESIVAYSNENNETKETEQKNLLETQTKKNVLPEVKYTCTLHGSKRIRDYEEIPEMRKQQQQKICEEMQIGKSENDHCNANENIDRCIPSENENEFQRNNIDAANFKVKLQKCDAATNCNSIKVSSKPNHLQHVTREKMSFVDARSKNNNYDENKELDCCNITKQHNVAEDYDNKSNNHVQQLSPIEELQAKSYDHLRTNKSCGYHKRDLVSLRHELQDKYAHCLENKQ